MKRRDRESQAFLRSPPRPPHLRTKTAQPVARTELGRTRGGQSQKEADGRRAHRVAASLAGCLTGIGSVCGSDLVAGHRDD